MRVYLTPVAEVCVQRVDNDCSNNQAALFVDVLYDGNKVRRFTHARIDTQSTHGTGCTLSSAIAALLANEHSLESAIAEALDFVHRAILTAPALGAGHGPLNFFA